MKRAFDIAVVLLALPFWAPVFLLVALTVLLIEGRPVFFTQLRTGLNEVPFRLRKFRTMRTGAGDDAARLTRFGRFLRATSLDELPELLHVLSGRMSLVGPRPLPVEYLSRYTTEQRRRHRVRPGITGWAQIHGRNDTTWKLRFQHDLWYTEHVSLWLDVKILVRTLVVVFTARGVAQTGSATMGEFKGRTAGGE